MRPWPGRVRGGGTLAVLVFSLTASGCLVSSLQPIYDEDAIVFDEALVGRWANVESEVTVDVARGEWRSYEIAYTDRFGTTRYTAHLTTVGDARFLNVRPEDGVERPPFLIVTNGILQFERAGEAVRVREPDYATLLARVKAGKAGIAATIDLRQNVLLTAPPARVRAWLVSSLDDEAMWAEWKTLTRSVR